MPVLGVRTCINTRFPRDAVHTKIISRDNWTVFYLLFKCLVHVCAVLNVALAHACARSKNLNKHLIFKSCCADQNYIKRQQDSLLLVVQMLSTCMC